MGTGVSMEEPPCNPVPAGKTRLCCAGFKVSTWTGRARKVVAYIAEKCPDKYESWFYFTGDFYKFTEKKFATVPFPDALKGHATSPFCWLERTADDGTLEITPLGGCSELQAWVKANCGDLLAADEAFNKLCTTGASLGEAFHNGAGAPQSTADVTKK